MLQSLGSLKLPFIAASAALFGLTYNWREGLGYDTPHALFQALIYGGLEVVVLYALMRSLSGRAV